METLHDFFKLVKNRLYNYDIDDISTNTDFTPYRYIYDMDEAIIRDYAYKIGEKLFHLEDSKIRSYGRVLLREFNDLFSSTFDHLVKVENKRIRVFKDKNRTSFHSYTPKEVEARNIEGGEEYYETYYFDHSIRSQDKELNVYPLMTDCYSLMYVLRNIFAEFDIDLREEAELLKLGIIFFDHWEEIKINNTKKTTRRTYNKRQITEAAQVLVIESILSEMGIKIEHNRSAATDFFNFITGKDMTPTPSGSNAYKRFVQADKKSKSYNIDCDVAADILNRVGLTEIADKIIRGKKTKNEDN